MMTAMENKPRIFRNAFNLFVGRGRQFSVCGVAEATEIERRTVQAHKDGECDVPTEKLVQYMDVLPEAFTNEILAHAGLERARRSEGGNPCTFAANESILSVAQRLGEMLANDGRFCHREQAEIAEKLFPELIEALNSWLAAHKQKDVVPLARKRGGAG